MVWMRSRPDSEKKALSIELPHYHCPAEVNGSGTGPGVYDSGGNLIALEGFISDITERKHAEAALQASDERYRGAIAAAGLVPLWH